MEKEVINHILKIPTQLLVFCIIYDARADLCKPTFSIPLKNEKH